MFGRRVLTLAVAQGVSALLAVLVVYLMGVLSDRPDEVVRSVTFATLVIANLSLIVVNRSWRLSIWDVFRERRNPTLKWILAGAGTLLLVLLLVPGLRHAFGFGPMTPLEWLVALVAGLAGVAWFEAYKVCSRR